MLKSASALQSFVLLRSTTRWTKVIIDRHVCIAETLYLRQARDGSILISVYQDAWTEKLQVPSDVASRPEEAHCVGRQV